MRRSARIFAQDNRTMGLVSVEAIRDIGMSETITPRKEMQYAIHYFLVAQPLKVRVAAKTKLFRNLASI